MSARPYRYARSGVVLEVGRPLESIAESPVCPGPWPRLSVQLNSPVEVDEPGAVLPRFWDLVLHIHPPGQPQHCFMSIGRRNDDHLIRAHGLADVVLCSDQIVVTPTPAATTPEVETLLLHHVLPKALHRLGRTCLHASAVARPSGNVAAFIAPSGSGKSTLAAAMALDPHAVLVSDDCLALDPDSLEAGFPRVFPSGEPARLRSGSNAWLTQRSGLRSVEHHTGKRHLKLATSIPASSLGAIYLLEKSRELELVRMRKAEVIGAIIPHLHRLDPLDRDLLGRELDAIRGLAEHLPVMRLGYPRRFEALESVVAAVWSHLTNCAPS